MAGGGEYPLLLLPEATLAARVITRPRGGGAPNPPKKRQIQRLDPQFIDLQRVLEARNALLSQTPGGSAPEHVLVFETNGPPQRFFETVKAHPELEWLLEYDERVEQDDDFKLSDSGRQISACVYMVAFNQKAIEQLLSFWHSYKTLPRMPNGLGAWSALFSCLRAVRRWGPEDRLREAGLLGDILEPLEPNRLIPVEIELWTRTPDRRAAAESSLRDIVENAFGAVLDRAYLPQIRYHALLVELPAGYLKRLLQARDVDLIQADHIYLLRPTPQCSVDVNVSQAGEHARLDAGAASGMPVCALLDGLPMENHPALQGHLLVDDPDGWGSNYSVAERRHGTAMASLLVHGDLDDGLVPLARPIYVRPILRPSAGMEQAPRNRLWIDLIHEAVRRIVATDGSAPPVAPSVRIINLSVGDSGRPFLHEPSPLARLLDWLAWKHHVLFIVSAGNHPVEFPADCSDDTSALRFVFGESRQRRLLSPAETLNGITVGALHDDRTPAPRHPHQRWIPVHPGLPAAYSALGRGFRRAVKPDVLMPGGRQIFQKKVPIAGAPWVPALSPEVGQLAAVPGPPGTTRVTRLSGTSNAAVLTSRAAAIIHSALEDLLRRPHLAGLDDVPMALLIKALLVHTAEWPSEAVAYAQQALGDVLDTNRSKDQLAGLFGYGSIRALRGVGCAPERATAIGGGALGKDERAIHRFPVPACLHLHRGWRRLTGTLAWFTPLNPTDRRYRVARLRLDLPRSGRSPLRVEGGQVHADATARGTLQHTILDQNAAIISCGENDELEVSVSCAEEAPCLSERVPYALAISVEVARETDLPIYQEVAVRLGVRVPVTVTGPGRS